MSSWVHQIISSLPEFSFSLVFLGGACASYGKPRYDMPDNVIHLQEHYLMEKYRSIKPRRTRRKVQAFAESVKLHHYLCEGRQDVPGELVSKFLASLGSKNGIRREDFLFSEFAWIQIREHYRRYCTEPSFVDYFWTIRTMHDPLLTLSEAMPTIPEEGAYHSISTGYAGFLGMLLRNARQRPFILSEHGIYTKKRKIDLSQASWIKEQIDSFNAASHTDVNYLRRLWIRFFEGIGRLTYDYADPIISLFEGNRKRQIRDGANEGRTNIIPNGIDLPCLEKLRERRPKGVPPILGLIGRVVPIKDIKTFIRSMRMVCSRYPAAEGWIIGPEDEDEQYARECRDLVTTLGLDGQVKFLGFQKIDDILPKLGLLVLTSISEALLLVILEGYASGLPCIATDVGSCRELIEGSTKEDRAIGPSGSVFSIAEPEAAAAAALRFVQNPDQWHAVQNAAIQRVERYYTEEMMINQYRDVYRTALEAAWQV